VNLGTLRTKIFADGADLEGMLALYRQSYIKGFTTNPTLMRKAGITDYRAFATQVFTTIPDRPISFGVFADDFSEMERQALEIATWGEHVYVKIPVTNTKRETAKALIHRLSHRGVKLNVTAVMTLDQVRDVVNALTGGAPSYVSVFAGRIADTGLDPVPLMTEAVRILESAPSAELMWASPRELLNIFQADAIGCHIITVTQDILKKLPLVGKDLDQYSLETVKMFHDDGEAAGFSLDLAARRLERSESLRMNQVSDPSFKTSRPHGGRARDTATSEAEPNASRSEAEPR
jgi:transaldolase